MQKLEQLHKWVENKCPNLSDMLALEAIYSQESFSARKKVDDKYFCVYCRHELTSNSKKCPYCHRIIIEDI